MTSMTTHTSYKPLGPGPLQEQALLWVRQSDEGYRPGNSGSTEAYRYWKGEPIFTTHFIWKEEDGSTHELDRMNVVDTWITCFNWIKHLLQIRQECLDSQGVYRETELEDGVALRDYQAMGELSLTLQMLHLYLTKLLIYIQAPDFDIHGSMVKEGYHRFLAPSPLFLGVFSRHVDIQRPDCTYTSQVITAIQAIVYDADQKKLLFELAASYCSTPLKEYLGPAEGRWRALTGREDETTQPAIGSRAEGNGQSQEPCARLHLVPRPIERIYNYLRSQFINSEEPQKEKLAAAPVLGNLFLPEHGSEAHRAGLSKTKIKGD